MWAQLFPYIILIIMLPAGLAISIIPIYLIYKVVRKAVRDGCIEAKGKYHKEEE